MPSDFRPDALAELRGDFGGDLFADGDRGHEDARAIFNSMIAKRPAAIAQCESAGDVRAAAVKAEYDPEGVFHLHHPIQPLAAT